MDTRATHRRRGIVKRVVLAATLCVALVAIATGVAAYRFFNDRPGERALRLVPANAIVFLSIDLSPSASQAMVFKKIDDALERNEMKGLIEQSYLDVIDPTRDVPELRELATRSGGFALLSPEERGGRNPVLVFINVTDGAKAESALRKSLKLRFFKGTQYYAFKHGEPLVSVVGDTLVLGSKPAELHAVRMVSKGLQPSATATPEYAAARAGLAPDANVMVFFNAASLKDLEPGNPHVAKISGALGWPALGLAIRDGGISVSVHGDFHADQFEPLKLLANIKPIRSDLFNVLPSGLYGAAAGTQHGSIASFAMEAAKQFGGEEDLAQFENDLRKEIGVDLNNDVIPNLQGNTVVGLYPSEGQGGGGLDILAVLDDQNGADPSILAEKARTILDQRFQEGEKKGALMVKEGGADSTIWTLAPSVQSEMEKGLAEGLSNMEIKGELLSRDKTVVYATEGKAVFICTSRKLLDRALAAYKTGAGSAASDVAVAQPGLIGDSQGLFVLNLGRAAEGVEKTVNMDQLGEGSEPIRGILDLLKVLDTPFYAKGHLSSKDFGAEYFIPLEYDRLLDFIGAQMKNSR